MDSNARLSFRRQAVLTLHAEGRILQSMRVCMWVKEDILGHVLNSHPALRCGTSKGAGSAVDAMMDFENEPEVDSIWHTCAEDHDHDQHEGRNLSLFHGFYSHDCRQPLPREASGTWSCAQASVDDISRACATYSGSLDGAG
eukprot:s2658_g8.t1